MHVLGVGLDTATIAFEVNLPVDLQGEFHTVEGIALDRALLVVVF